MDTHKGIPYVWGKFFASPHQSHRSRFVILNLLFLFDRAHTGLSFISSLLFSKCDSFSGNTSDKVTKAFKGLLLVSTKSHGSSERFCMLDSPQIFYVCNPCVSHARPRHFCTRQIRKFFVHMGIQIEALS